MQRMLPELCFLTVQLLPLQYTSVFALTEGESCPISAAAQTEIAYHTCVPGSGLGRLLNGTYCNPLRRGVAEHQVYPDRTGLQPDGFVLSSP